MRIYRRVHTGALWARRRRVFSSVVTEHGELPADELRLHEESRYEIRSFKGGAEALEILNAVCEKYWSARYSVEAVLALQSKKLSLQRVSYSVA